MAISLVGSTGGAGAANGGTLTQTIPVTVLSGDMVVVAACLGSSLTGAFTVSSSSGGAFTQALSSVFQSSSIRLGVFYQRSSGQALTQVVTSGTGASSDTTSAVIMVFRGVSTSVNPTAQTSNGSGTTPDSPSITPAGGSSAGVLPYAAITTFAAMIQDATVTQPSSWALTGNSNATDNWPSTVCAAWLTYNSTAALDPAAWSGLTTATWVSASILLTPTFVPGAGVETAFPADHLLFPPYQTIGY